jgi:hypothetical protein
MGAENGDLIRLTFLFTEIRLKTDVILRYFDTVNIQCTIRKTVSDNSEQLGAFRILKIKKAYGSVYSWHGLKFFSLV